MLAIPNSQIFFSSYFEQIELFLLNCNLNLRNSKLFHLFFTLGKLLPYILLSIKVNQSFHHQVSIAELTAAVPAIFHHLRYEIMAFQQFFCQFAVFFGQLSDECLLIFLEYSIKGFMGISFCDLKIFKDLYFLSKEIFTFLLYESSRSKLTL